jgi:putative ABC transport system permease protein
MVGIYNQHVPRGGPADPSPDDFVVWRRELKSVEALGAFQPLERNLITEDGRIEPVRGAAISASAFRLLRILPVLGRPLVEEDERAGAPPVVVLGHELWKGRFDEDPGVVGRTVRLGGVLRTVVGVMPRGFAFPINHSLWVPLGLDARDHEASEGGAVKIFGRLAPGVGLDRAQSELTAIGLRDAAGLPATNQSLRPRIQPYVQSLWLSQQDGVGQMRVLYSLNLFFLGLLGVCAANVATLVFARTVAREGEITLRTALGAGRARIVAQLFAEALVLAVAAAAIGLTVAGLILRSAKAIFADTGNGAPLPFWWNDRFAPATLLYVGMLTVLAAGIIGVVPALKATGLRLQAGLKHAAAGGSAMTLGRLWTGVIVCQVALTVVFLLIVVSVGWNLHVGRYGVPAAAFPADRYLGVRLEMDPELPTSASAETVQTALRPRFQAAYRELERRLTAEPGVGGVTNASRLPGMDHLRLLVEMNGIADAGRWVRTATVDPDFFETFDAPIVAGRAFDSADVELDRKVAIVDQAFVRQLLHGLAPIGRRVRLTPADDGEPGSWYEIVGVVRDLTVGQYKTAGDAVLYRPAAADSAYPIHMAVQVRGDPRSLAPRLRSIAAEVDPALRLYGLIPLDELGRTGGLAYSLVVRALAVLGAIALLLSTAGVYSLMSFTVARRTREIGIRAALGADRRRIVVAIFSRALAQVGLGIVAGGLPGTMLVAWGAPEIARGGGLVVGVAAFTAVAAFMLAVSMLACAVPAGRALRIQPTGALRADG